MKVAIDISHMERDKAGIGRLIAGLVAGFKELPTHEYLLISRNLVEFELPANFRLKVIPAVPKYLGGGIAWYWKLGKYLRQQKYDLLVLATLNLGPVFFERSISVINDLTPLEHPEYYGRFFNWRYRIFLNLAVHKSKYLAAISQTTADKLTAMYKLAKPVAVVKLGLDEWATSVSTRNSANAVQNSKFKIQNLNSKSIKQETGDKGQGKSRNSTDSRQPIADSLVETGGMRQDIRNQESTENRQLITETLPDKYFLSLSTLQPRKNYERMIEAFAIFLQDHPDYYYLISGRKGWQYESIFETIDRLGLQDRVRHLAFAPDEDLPYLFDHAAALLFVSLDEGFGIPVIQALARGIPVVASDIPVLRELSLRDRVLFADPYNVDHIAAALDDVVMLESVEDTEDIKEKYSWLGAAKSVLVAAEIA